MLGQSDKVGPAADGRHIGEMESFQPGGHEDREGLLRLAAGDVVP